MVVSKTYRIYFHPLESLYHNNEKQITSAQKKLIILQKFNISSERGTEALSYNTLYYQKIFTCIVFLSSQLYILQIIVYPTQ